MDIDDFHIRQIVFEIRYDNAYAIWDCAGAVTSEIAKLWPGATLGEVSPNKQVLQNDDASIQTTISRAHVALQQPKGITQFADQINKTLKIWINALDIKKFTRVGTRVMYTHQYPTQEAADNAVVSLNLVRYPTLPIFNHKVMPKESEIRILWEDETTQTQVIIKSEHHKMEILGFLDAPREKQEKTADVMLVDIDRAIKGDVPIEKFNTSEWLEGVRHLISRDLNRILNS